MPSPFRSAGFRWFVVAPLMFVVFVASALFVTFHLVHASTVPKRDAAVAELDAADPTWRAPAINTARNATLPPPDRNAAELASRANEMATRAGYKWDDNTEAGRRLSQLKSPHLPHKSDLAGPRKQLAKAREAVQLARDIRNVPGGGFALEFKEPNPLNTLLPKHQGVRQVCGLLSYDAMVLAYDRRFDDSLDSCLAAFAVARGYGDEPLFIPQLIRMAGVAVSVAAVERTLNWGDGFDDARLAALDKAFAEEANAPRLLHGLRGERAMFDRICANIDSGQMAVAALSDGKPNLGEELLAAPYRSRLPEEHAVGLAMYTELIAAASLPPGHDRTVKLGTIEDKYFRLARGQGPPLPRYILISLLMPAVQKMNESDTRTTAKLNTARVALACERHRAKTGAFPEKLDDLPKELLAEVPADPWSGKPLLYKKLDDGMVVYSVGFDRVDDGGVTLEWGREKNTDSGIRLWTPEHRRKPPEPLPEPLFHFDFDDKPKPGASTAPPRLSPWVPKE